MQQQNFTPLYPPLQVRAGVLVVDGFGIALRVLNRGKLRVEDGIGRQRRSLTLDRAGSGLERLVLIGHAGYVTLEALAWLRAIGAALVQIGRDGEVLAHSVPFGYDGHPIRRAQALAVTNGLDLAIARELIAGKLDGQRRILVRLGADLREFDKLRAALDSADSIERVRVIEANAAALYFRPGATCGFGFASATSHVSRRAGCARDSRASVLTGAPRAATSPINAMRNYLFACLESEARLALLAHGCDPTMGVPACRSAQPRFTRTRRHGAGARGRGRLFARPSGRSDVHGSRFRRASERHLPDRSTVDARTRTHAAALARMPAADRGAPRTNLPRIAGQQRRIASHACS